jgi:energy-coupling factor transporter ATP-binding protein EcfA2
VTDRSLADVAWHLLTSAAELYRDSPRASRWLVGCLERLADPLRIAVAGQAGVGKSTLVNALAGEHVAPIEVGGGTGVFAWYLDGAEPAAVVFPPGAPAVPVAVTRRDRRLYTDLRQWQPEQVERVVVEWPARGLRDMALIDTPTGTPPEWLAGTVDAVVYATRDPSDADLALLRAAQTGDPTAAVTTIVALARADELGAGRIDALSSAKQIARRRRSDAAVHAVCQNVVAVAGLLGQAGRTLREDEFAVLRGLAGIARAELDTHLLSADRFVHADLPVRLSPDARVELLDRFGVFGIRLASTLIRRGADSQSGLAGQLVQRSGLSELRESIGSFFTDRADVLRARSALAGMNVVLRGEPRPRSGQLAAAAERALAGAHDLAELRLLSALRAGRLTLPGTLADTAERLAGGLGTGIADRLGLPGDAAEDDVRNAVYDELGQWRAQAESPLLGAAARAAAHTVVRSCEGLLTALAPPAHR